MTIRRDIRATPLSARLDRRQTVAIKAEAKGTSATGASAIGAFLLGAMAFGAFAVGAVAIGRLSIGKARIRKLRIDELEVGRLIRLDATDDPQSPQQTLTLDAAE